MVVMEFPRPNFFGQFDRLQVRENFLKTGLFGIASRAPKRDAEAYDGSSHENRRQTVWAGTHLDSFGRRFVEGDLAAGFNFMELARDGRGGAFVDRINIINFSRDGRREFAALKGRRKVRLGGRGVARLPILCRPLRLGQFDGAEIGDDRPISGRVYVTANAGDGYGGEDADNHDYDHDFDQREAGAAGVCGRAKGRRCHK